MKLAAFMGEGAGSRDWCGWRDWCGRHSWGGGAVGATVAGGQVVKLLFSSAIKASIKCVRRAGMGVWGQGAPRMVCGAGLCRHRAAGMFLGIAVSIYNKNWLHMIYIQIAYIKGYRLHHK